MGSPTVQSLAVEDVRRIVDVTFDGATVTGAEPLAGGGYAAVWSVDLIDGDGVRQATVLKLGPPAAATLLRYEHDLIGAEADYFTTVRSHAPAVPVPTVLCCGQNAIYGSWLFTTRLPGTSLPMVDHDVDVAAVRYALGRQVAAIHAITADRYGYSGKRPHGVAWAAAFSSMVESLLADAQDWAIDLGDYPARVRRLLTRARLDVVQRCSVIHFDLWDGNVLCEVVGGTARLSGLVDGERWLGGDPLVDFVSPALFRRIEDEPDHPFLAGYREATGGDPLSWPCAVQRLRLYRLYLALLMRVEQPSRGEFGPKHADRTAFLDDQLNRQLTDAEVAAR